MLSHFLSVTLSHTLFYPCSRRPLYTQMRCYIPDLSVNRYILLYSLDESRCPASLRAATVFSAVVLCFGCDVSKHTRSHNGFADYKFSIRAIIANPFLLSYTRPSCLDIRPGYLLIITIIGYIYIYIYIYIYNDLYIFLM